MLKEKRDDMKTRNRKPVALIFAFMVCTGMLASQAVQAEEKLHLTFGVVPQQSASKLARTWGPILALLSRETGISFKFKTAPSIPEFEKRVRNGEYDIAYMNPYHYTEFSDAPGYRAFAKARGKQIRGIIVVPKDTSAETLEDLHGEKIAFPAPAAFAASVLPRAHMANSGIDIMPVYVSSHDSVYMSVAAGLYPAGGGVKRTLSTIDPKIRAKLDILWTTEPYTSHALAAHPEMDPALVSDITRALVELEDSEEGRRLLETLAWKGVEPATDRRWDDVRGLGIDLLKDLVATADTE